MEQDANGQAAGLGVGVTLKAARERAGMSLREVAERLKLSVRQLEAIEEDDFQQLPGATFVRGFVRNYARFLQVDPEPLMARLEQHFPSAVNDVVNLVKHESPAEAVSIAETLTRLTAPRRSTGKWLGGLLLVGVIAAGLWFVGQQGRQAPAVVSASQPMSAEQPASAALPASAVAQVAPAPAALPASQPVALASSAMPVQKPALEAAASQPAASAAAADAAAGKITLSAREAAWISVVDASGKKLQFGTLEAGSSKELTGTPPFQLKIGNATQVQLSFNGQPVDLTDKIRGSTAKIELK